MVTPKYLFYLVRFTNSLLVHHNICCVQKTPRLPSGKIGRYTGHRNSPWCHHAGAQQSLPPPPHERYTNTLGTTSPSLYEQCVCSLMSHRLSKSFETGSMVYRPRRLESLTICSCLYKDSSFSSGG